MIKVYPYRAFSRSARRLAAVLGGRVLREQTLWQPQRWDVVINWGSSECPFHSGDCRLLNPASNVRLAANKAKAFEWMQKAGVNVPDFTRNKSEAKYSLTVVRHKLTGHSGEGIEIVEEGNELPDAPLYVRYIKKKDEYRIHVVGDQVTTIQRKAKRNEIPKEDCDFRVRNLAGGFVFVRSDVNPPEGVLAEARGAIKALGLDFGAVDVIWNDKDKKAYILEVNTAPGMEGTTINEYAEGFKKLLKAN